MPIFHSTLYQLHQVAKKYGSFLIIISILIALLFTNNCAQIEPLGGGPQDTIPPKLIRTYPLQESTRFKGNKLQLIFDKEIEIQNVYNKLIVTPKLPHLEDKPSYVCKARGNKVELILAVPLEEATTYTFNFKDAICDTRERIPAENPTLTFSTGDDVDSMYVTGQVHYLMTDQPAADALVTLYKISDTDTSHILNSTPDYFTKTNQNGEFRLEHLKQATYRLCAGYSKENKLVLDPSKEPYGFLPDPINLVEPIDSIPLYILEANVSDFKIHTSQPQGQYFEISFSKPVSSYLIEFAHPSKRFKGAQLYSHLIEEEHTIRIYNTLGLLEDDMLEAKLIAHDAMDNKIEQNITIHFRDRKIKKEPFKYTLSPTAGSKMGPTTFKVNIAFNKPIKTIQTDSLFLVVGQADTIPLHTSDIMMHSHHDAITIQKTLYLSTGDKEPENRDTIATKENEKNATINLHIAKGAFISVEKELNEVADHKYFIANPQEYGLIKGSILTQFPGFIIQLLNEQYEVIQEIKNKRYYEFTDILPGIYKIRVLVLQEKDGKWHFGNINQFIPPDPVIFYPHELTLVANWELEDIDFKF